MTRLARFLERLQLLPRSQPAASLRSVRLLVPQRVSLDRCEHSGCDHRRGCRVVAAARMVC